MSKKDYIAIAKAIANATDLNEASQLIANYFEANNELFDRERFLKASGF